MINMAVNIIQLYRYEKIPCSYERVKEFKKYDVFVNNFTVYFMYETSATCKSISSCGKDSCHFQIAQNM